MKTLWVLTIIFGTHVTDYELITKEQSFVLPTLESCKHMEQRAYELLEQDPQASSLIFIEQSSCEKVEFEEDE
jgi:hypothetical protein